MSWKATAYVAEIIDNVTRSEKLLFLCLANRFNDDEGCAWVSVPRLARESLMSERTAHAAIDGLIRKGYLEVGERPGQSSVYLITGFSGTGPTPAKTAGVNNWRTPAELARKALETAGVPRNSVSETAGVPPQKELITRIEIDSTAADEQRTGIRTVKEPANEPSGNVAGADAPREPEMGGASLEAFRQALSTSVLRYTVAKLTEVPPSVVKDYVILTVGDVQLRRQLQEGNGAVASLRKTLSMCALAAGFKGYTLAS